MTPLEIEMLLHYHWSPQDYRNGDFSAPAVRKTIDWFKGPAALLERAQEAERCYKLTERGHAYVLDLCALPLPPKSATHG